MSSRGWLILAGGLLSVALAFVVVLMVRDDSRATPAPPRPPELGGQQVPDTVFEIRFDRRYDLHCSMDWEEPALFRDCKILGFTGRGDAARSGRAVTSGSFSLGSGSGSSSGRYFEHWLVLERADGRLAYIPPEAVRYIEESAPDGG